MFFPIFVVVSVSHTLTRLSVEEADKDSVSKMWKAP